MFIVIQKQRRQDTFLRMEDDILYSDKDDGENIN